MQVVNKCKSTAGLLSRPQELETSATNLVCHLPVLVQAICCRNELNAAVTERKGLGRRLMFDAQGRQAGICSLHCWLHTSAFICADPCITLLPNNPRPSPQPAAHATHLWKRCLRPSLSRKALATWGVGVRLASASFTPAWRSPSMMLRSGFRAWWEVGKKTLGQQEPAGPHFFEPDNQQAPTAQPGHSI